MKRPIVIVLLTLALVFVLAGIGAILFFTVSNSSLDIVNDAFNVSAASEETQTLEVDEPVTLKVINEQGDVTVIGADVDAITVEVVKTGFGKTQNQAETALSNIEYTLDQTGNTVNLVYKFPKPKRQVDEKVDFVVTVPFETGVEVDAAFGELNVSGIQGDVIVENNFGNITIDKVDGKLDANTSSGKIEATSIKAGAKDIDIFSGFGRVTLEQVSGANINVRSQSGNIELENVRATKEMYLSTDFGKLEFKTGSADTLEAKTNSGSIELASVTVKGQLTIRDDFGDVTLEQVKAASYDVESNSGSITIDGVKGLVKAHTGFGSIKVENAEDVTLDLDTNSGSIEFSGTLGEGPHTVHSDFGEIELNIPADSALNIKMETQFGKITSDIPITVTLTGEIKDGQQSGTMNGGGAELKVDTNSGNIHIKILK
ncbi:MAG TPA: DUF4097 family beta strand repeat-containing protein [Anaerolineales bacterium]